MAASLYIGCENSSWPLKPPTNNDLSLAGLPAINPRAEADHVCLTAVLVPSSILHVLSSFVLYLPGRKRNVNIKQTEYIKIPYSYQLTLLPASSYFFIA